MKLPLREAEHEALLEELVEWDGYVSSALLGVEGIRTCGRYGDRYADEARSFLADIALLPLDDTVLAEAASIDPAELRSLDALHLATALSVRDEVGVFVTYDRRLEEAAREAGLERCEAGLIRGQLTGYLGDLASDHEFLGDELLVSGIKVSPRWSIREG